jgi:hypothetical protein
MIVTRAPETSQKPFTPAEKLRLIGEISTTYVRVRWLLSTGKKMPQVVEVVRAGVGSEDASEVPKELLWFALRLGRAVEKNLEKLPGDTRCLTRSVVLVRMLARRGLASTLVIGVRPAPSFGAHAWVEMRGRPLLSPTEYAGGRLAEF